LKNWPERRYVPLPPPPAPSLYLCLVSPSLSLSCLSLSVSVLSPSLYPILFLSPCRSVSTPVTPSLSIWACVQICRWANCSWGWEGAGVIEWVVVGSGTLWGFVPSSVESHLCLKCSSVSCLKQLYIFNIVIVLAFSQFHQFALYW
jgi:hypothetical protein